ncbi:hypothetical protein C8Q76DRAFT_796194 [Earliella scabrosa]|nr:hypothetical protein C8Q76DRAFT_796194 [Earliella scabrosa]
MTSPRPLRVLAGSSECRPSLKRQRVLSDDESGSEDEDSQLVVGSIDNESEEEVPRTPEVPTARFDASFDIKSISTLVNVPMAVIERLPRFITFNYTFGPWFGMGATLPRTTWYPFGPEMSALQYVDKPIRLWATGMLVSMNVSVPGEDQSPHTRIAINLINKTDMQVARALLNLAGESYKHPIVTLNAVCVKPFASIADRIYDASYRYTLAERMPTLPFWELAQGDIVVLECFLVRTKVGYRWCGSFHAKSLMVIWRKPRTSVNIVDSAPTFPPFWYL